MKFEHVYLLNKMFGIPAPVATFARLALHPYRVVLDLRKLFWLGDW